jgi:hypothetical protein
MNLAEIIVTAFRLWPLFLEAAVLLLIAYFGVNIDPAQVYDFRDALLHGAFWYQNVFLALFTDHLYYAPLNTGLSYRLGFIIGMLALPALISVTVQIIRAWREAMWP